MTANCEVNMRDPRTKRFYELQKRDRSQLSRAELEEYLDVCIGMIEYVTSKKSRHDWVVLRRDVEQRLQSQPGAGE